MTYHPLVLEEFGRSRNPAQTTPNADIESVRLEAFETGYKSGWDDAVEEQETSGKHVASNLERSLSDLNFSYEEARSEVLSGLSDLFQKIVDVFLPAMAAASVGPLVSEELNAILDGVESGHCEILAAPETCRQLAWLSDAHMDTELTIQHEPAFAEGRVQIRVAQNTREIDLSNLVEQMSAAIIGFADTTAATNEDRAHG